MGKIFTLAEARAQLGKFVDNGTCSTSVIDSRINEAVQRLIIKKEVQDSPRLNYLVRLKVLSSEFALPRGVEKIMAVNVNGTPGHVFNKMYQFLSSGPGDLDNYAGYMDHCARHIMDLGEFPYQFPVPVSSAGAYYNLVAFSTSLETTKLKIWGYDSKANEVVEELQINPFTGGVKGSISGSFGSDGSNTLSTNKFKDITRIAKSQTKGAVTLYAVDPATNEMWFIAEYHAKETIPMFRRYRVTNKDRRSGVANDERTDTCILAMVKLGHVELSEDDDLVPIDNISALKLMLIAIKFENDGDLNKSVAFEANAVRVLEDVNDHHKMAQGTPIIIDFEKKLMGGVTNRWPFV